MPSSILTGAVKIELPPRAAVRVKGYLPVDCAPSLPPIMPAWVCFCTGVHGGKRLDWSDAPWAAWTAQDFDSVPVWHMHESMEKLGWLVDDFPRVAIGSSAQFAKIATKAWWPRIAEAMTVACDAEGYPKTRLHGLRQMDPRVFSVIPYSSVDSTAVARAIGIDSKWTGSYIPRSKKTRALVVRDNISFHVASRRWPGIGGIQQNWELFG